MSTYVVYDFETTGKDMLKDRVVEVAALLVENKKIKDSFVTIINCGKESHPEALSIHGIDFEQSRKGMEPKKAFKKLANFVEGHYLLAHNGNGFDHFFLKTEFHRHGIETPDCKLLDSLLLAKHSKLGLSKFKLENLCEHFNIKNSQAHRSLGDTEALLKIFEILREKTSDLEAIHKISYQKKLRDIFPHLEGFEMLVEAMDKEKKLEITYENEKAEVKRRWIRPLNTKLHFGSMCPLIIAECLTDEIEKTFRLDRIREFYSVK